MSSPSELLQKWLTCPPTTSARWNVENFIIIANCLNVSADELLASEINNGHLLRMSAYLEKMKDLNEEKQKIICDIIEVLLKN
nr:hypothetical protein [uncultured Blautia sp.]